jgi:flagellar biosynthesis chaperone FliJ
MKYEQWLTNPIRFLSMTGYSIEKFKELLPHFKEEHDLYLSKYDLKGKFRNGTRKYLIYENSPLSTHSERLVFILSYIKLNPIQEAHADMFSMQQKQCNEFIHGLKVILDKTLQTLSVMPATTAEQLQAKLALIDKKEDKQLLHDGTEREIPRPQNEDDQKEFYSGKKKKHTVKNAVIINMVCTILFLSLTVNAKIHDKKLADTHYTIKEGFELWQDTGYQGFKPNGVLIRQPIKKPKGKELTEQQKQYNRYISQVRVRVEHAIGSMKRYRIVKDECRLRKNKFVHSILHTCAALHNFRILKKTFQYPDYQVVNKPT